MVNNLINSDVERTIFLIREHIDTIRINLEILEALKISGRIRDNDKKYREIVDLESRSRKSINDFILAEFPSFIEGNSDPAGKVLRKSYIEWATGLLQSLIELSRLISNYIRHLAEMDHFRHKPITREDIRDKRFWDFLEKEHKKAGLFGSFEIPPEPENSEKSAEPEEGEGNQQAKEE